jgi:hypothetical protein
MKEETLEEAAERNYNEAGVNAYFNNGFIRGAKWQQERMYSEEEVIDLLNYLGKDKQDLYDWFEQFKKK